MFEMPREVLDRRRPLARVILGVALICLLVCGWMWNRKSCATPFEASSGLSKRFRLSPWVMLAPAVLSIAIWSYYPLLRGAVMAFQNYRIVGESSWSGLDNFIMVATDSGFWKAWGRTLEYVALTLLLGFLTPIFLALMLSEIPRGKIFYRTLYFLPHLTSALVMGRWKA